MIERHGIEPIPPVERRVGAGDLFVIWAGLNICLPSFLIGAIMIPSLGFLEASISNLIGNLILGIWIVLMGYMGIKYGIPSMVVCRSVFGHPAGDWIPSLLIFISGIGWFAVQAELCGLAIDQIFVTLGFSNPTLFIIIAGLLTSTTAVVGYSAIRRLSRISIPLLTLLCIWITWVILSRYGFYNLISYQPTHEVPFGATVDWVVGGLAGGCLLASDYSRYGKSYKASWIGCMNGVLPVCVFLAIVGIFSTLATGDWNPINSVVTLGLGIPALLILVLATWTTNDNNLYSSGLAGLNLAPRIGRIRFTLACGILGTILATFRITTYFESFLSLLAIAFSPLLGVIFADYFLIKKQTIDVKELYIKGKYYYKGGVNLPALFAFGAGIVGGILVPPAYIKSLISFLISFLLYMLVKGMPLKRKIKALK
jgi:cytosine permease